MGGWLLPAFGVLLRVQITVKRLVCSSFDKNWFFFLVGLSSVKRQEKCIGFCYYW